MPEAIPDLAGATTPIAVAGMLGLHSPTPNPISRKPGSSAVQPELLFRPRIDSSPIPTNARPAVIRLRTPTRSIARAAARGDKEGHPGQWQKADPCL